MSVHVAAVGTSVLSTGGGSLQPWRQGANFFSLACLRSTWMRYGGCWANSGDSYSAILARLSTVTGATPKPAWCVIEGGINETNGASAASMATLTTIADTLAAADIRPVLTTVLPTTVGADSTNNQAINVLMRPFAASRGYVLVDFWDLLADPVDGTWATPAYTSDNTHPSAAGSAVMADYLVSTLAPLVGSDAPPLPPAHSSDLLAGIGIFDTAGGQGQDADWSRFATTVPTYSMPTDGTITAGKWQRQAANHATQQFGIYKLNILPAAGWAVGDRLLFTGRVRGSGAGQVVISTTFTGAATEYLHPLYTVPCSALPTDGAVFAMERTIPASATALRVDVALTPTQIGDYLDVAQVGLYNITTSPEPAQPDFTLPATMAGTVAQAGFSGSVS